MAIPYVLTALHKNFQRVGAIYLLVREAPESRTRSQVDVARAYGRALFEKVQPEPSATDRLQVYFEKRGVASEYHRGVQVDKSSMAVEFQDWALSDTLLPSATGRERETTLVQSVAAAVELGFLDDAKLTKTTYGQLLATIEGLETAAHPDLNPYSPTATRAAPILNRLFEYDFRLMRPLVERIPSGEFTFRDALVSEASLVLEEALASIPITRGSRRSREWLAKQIGNAKRLDDRLAGHAGGSQARTTLFRPLEDLFIPRLELLVDAGLLGKTDRYQYAYNAPKGGIELTRRFLNEVDGPPPIDSGFFAFFAGAHSRHAEFLEDPQDVVSFLRPAFERSRSVSGYAPIVECAILANAMSCVEGRPETLEIKIARDVLLELASSGKSGVRVVADRQRRPREFILPGG